MLVRKLTTVVFLGAMSAALAGCVAPSFHHVTYSVTGSGNTASLTYQNAQGETQQEDVKLPWTKSFTFKDGDLVTVQFRIQENKADD